MNARKLRPNRPAQSNRIWRNLLFLVAILPMQGASPTLPEEALSSTRVQVLPIFFVP